MEDRIKKQFTEGILDEILRKFDLDKSKTREVDAFENFVYISEKGFKKYILRVSHTIRRTKNQMLSELEFLLYLQRNKLNVPRAFKSRNNNLVEEVSSEEGSFLACLFECIDGSIPTEALRNEELFYKMGMYMGNFHNLSMKYNEEKVDRLDFFDVTTPLFDWIPKEDTKIKQIAKNTLEKIRKIPQTKKNYGLIHADFHFGNFLLRENEIVLFDFDDCQYSWFIHDIAMSLFYYLPINERNSSTREVGHHFLKQYLRGYRTIIPLEKEMLVFIEDFMKCRELELYGLIHRSFDMNALPEWPKNFMLGRKEKIERNEPYFSVDIDRIW